MTAVALIVGLVILTDVISDNTASMTTRMNVVNASITTTAGTTTTLNGKVIDQFIAINDSSGATIPASNYTITNNVILSDGTLGATVAWKTGWLLQPKANVSYRYEPLGYVADTGSQAIVGLIVLFCAVALVVVAVSPILRSWIVEKMSA